MSRLKFTTLTTLAIDNGFRIVVYFAGIKVNLLVDRQHKVDISVTKQSYT
jgi:hypothetical protein